MKKTYVKPEAFCEEYMLSTSIAGNCGIEHVYGQTNKSDYNNCYYRIGLDYLFTTPEIECDTFPAYDGDKIICYHEPVESSKVFSS